MADYTKITNFSVKDTLASGNPAKVIRGAEFDAEFNNIETAVNSKADEAELATEIQDRQAADQALQDSLNTEETARISADNTLQSNIDAEASARQSADNILQGNIDAEASARQSADSTLQSNIDAEEASRIAADNTLQSNIDLKADKANPVFTGTFDVQSSNGAYIDLNDSAVSGTVESGLRLLRSGNNNDFEVLNTGAALTFSSGADVIASPTERMRLTSDGKLGIGKDNPNTTLDILGNFRVVNAAFGIQLDGTEVSQTNTAGELVLSSGVNDFQGSSRIRFKTDNTERMRLTSDGYLKADPSGSYDLNVNTNFAGRPVHQIVSRNGDHGLAVSSLAPLGSTNLATLLINGLDGDAGSFIKAETQSNTKFLVYKDGSIENSTGSYGALSDIKLKENITDATPKLDDILALRFVNFDLKDNTDLGKQFGVIAQELEEVFPNLVINTPDTEEVETTDEEGNTVTETVETGTVTKSVKYSVLTLMAVKALQELKAEKDELAVEHESLKDQVRLLTERIEAIEANN